MSEVRHAGPDRAGGSAVAARKCALTHIQALKDLAKAVSIDSGLISLRAAAPWA